ncbi:MAG: hypothetical protein IPL71_20175 [Anaerolineales bacterium]|uniref:hypothetical protein n=1 Tax=Candidatus Villigracilis proximus TaxID=3140683 RepID=UPI003136FBA8|nr:hypothetical protein [Anaerolineales bacterium]
MKDMVAESAPFAKDLGVDEAAAEMILHLRSQVVELQTRLRQMETELNERQTSQQLRLTRYREVYYEATWMELEIKE